MSIKTRLENISIAHKVTTISFIAMFGFVAFLIVLSVATREVNTLMTEIETIDKPVMNAMDENFITFFEARNNVSEAVSGMDISYMDIADKDIKKIFKGLDTMAKIGPVHLDQVEALRLSFKSYVDASFELVEYMEGEAEYVTTNELTKKYEKADQAYQEAHKNFRQQLESGFNKKLQASARFRDSATRNGLIFAVIFGGILFSVAFTFGRMIKRALNNAIKVAQKIAAGDRDMEVIIESQDETGQLLTAIDEMREGLRLKEIAEAYTTQEQTDAAGLNDTLRGEHDIEQLTQRVVNYLTPIFDAQVAALYLVEGEKLKLISSYAFTRSENFTDVLGFGETLVGQSALEKRQIVVNNVPDNYIAVSSALGKAAPKTLVVTPIVNDGRLEGVLEIGSVNGFDERQLAFLEKISSSIAIAINSTASRHRLSEILTVTQNQADALRESEAQMQEQQEELRASNEELEEHATELAASEQRLQLQQEELRVTNEELEEQAQELENQKVSLERNNRTLEQSQIELEEKSEDLRKSSQYKSEFLSTMSHELRTPLNSILILSQILADNQKQNLDNKQVQHAEVINSAGSDLLELINDILDLSKIEEGKLDFVVDKISLSAWTAKLNKNFSHVLADKGLDFSIKLDSDLPDEMLSDEHRIDQVVKNMISNAMKFTESGSVTIDVTRPKSCPQFDVLGLKVEDCVAFSVIDTGIGIPEEKQKLIFEAFQQADGTTSRNFGGTGLGLTISRQLSNFLGGDLIVSSEGEGRGSTFSLVVPLRAPQVDELPPEVLDELQSSREPVEEMHQEVTRVISETSVRADVLKGTLMIIEDDDVFASTLGELAQDYGLNVIRAEDGECALKILESKLPSAIILDVGLPGMDGWAVMDKLKENEQTKDIPVHFISGQDSQEKAIGLGAMEFLMKPVSPDQLIETFARIEEEASEGLKKLLVIEDNEAEILSIEEMFKEKDLVMTVVSTGEQAIAKLAGESFDCMIMDLDLPDINGLSLLETLNDSADFKPIPVIVYTAKDLSREEESRLRPYASRIILKAGQSSERLLSEVSLFLHWLENNGEETHRPLSLADSRDDLFQNKRVLIVDDDMRNIYSLSAVLEGVGLKCNLTSNGIECLESLKHDRDIDIILMDIMMPEMDGYEAMGKIREQEQFKDMPIIALTAKAMKEDKQKCLDAGANDYITKPLDTDKLLALMRLWMSQAEQKLSA